MQSPRVLQKISSKVLRKRISSNTKIKIAIVTAVILALIIYIFCDVFFNGPLTNFLSNKDAVVNWVRGQGVTGILLYIGIQILQVVAAPIPGQIVGGVGGFVFGWWGVLWTTIGTAIGATLVFWLSRKFGRPLVEKVFKKTALDKFDFIVGKDAPFLIFIIFLIPGLPDDMICYLAGLTTIPLKKLVGLMLLGRFPVIIITNYIGAGVEKSSYLPVVVTVIVTVIILALFLWQKDRIMRYLKSKAEK